MADKKITELTAWTTPIDTDLLPIVDVTAGTTKKITKANLTLNKTDKLTVTAVKTANYTANANELVPCDISAGSFTVTLPSAPATGSIVEVKLVTLGSQKVLTLACGGTDKFNTATGNTAIYMTLQGEVLYVQYASGIWYVLASATTYDFATNFPGVDATTPLTQADIAFNPTTRVLTITPPLGYFNIFVGSGYGDIIRYRKTGNVNFPAITDTSGSWYFYFNSSGTAVSTQTAWLTTDFPTAVPIYRLLWNATLYRFTVTAANATVGATYTNNGVTYTVVSTIAGGTTLDMTGTGDPEASGDLTKASGTGDATIAFSAFSSALKPVAEYVEYHINDISADDHQWFHLYGAIWRSGAEMKNNAITSGSPAANGSNSVVALTTASIVDDNLGYVITNGTGGAAWEQDMGNTTPASLTSSNSGLFPIYTQNAGGLVSFLTATRFPFAFNASTNLPQFITSLGVRTDVTTTNFFVYFIYATQNPKTGQAIKLVSATSQFTSITNARAYTWTDIQNSYSILNDGEIRPLYRLIFETKSSGSAYDVGAKYSALRETQDLRKAAVTTTTTATGSIPASSVTVVAAGGIASTNSQSALEELDSEKANLASPTFTGTVTTPAIKITTGAGANKLLTSDADGDATWENAPVSVNVTTKGDIQTYSTAPDRLPVGTNGYVLEARSTEATGLKWIAAPGSNSFVTRELVNETPDGAIVDFTVDASPVAGSESVYLNGQLQNEGASNDYTISGDTITFNTAPLTGSIILVSYQSVASTSGNADTLDSFHASATPTVATIPVLDSEMAMIGNSMARQALINGNFDVWQRGVTSSTFTDATATFVADRWFDLPNDDGGTRPTLTRTREVLTPGDIPNSYFYTRLTSDGAGTSLGAGSYHALLQRIENGTRFLCGNGKKVTLSFWARSSIAGKRLGIALQQNYGSGGSPSTLETINGTHFDLTSSWAKYTYTFTTNTLAGKTFGTANDDYVQPLFAHIWGSTYLTRYDSPDAETYGGSGTLDIAQVQLCAGDVALPFMPRSYGQELEDCQRYYIRYGGTAYCGFGTGLSSTTTAALVLVHFPTSMRIVPAFSYGGASAIRAVWGSSNADCSNIVQSVNSDTKVAKLTATTSGMTADHAVYLQANNDTTSYIDFSAEL